jgi:hypothetical protein
MTLRTPFYKNLLSWALATCVVALATVFPRLMVMGDFPSTDEGFYAYQSLIFHHHLTSSLGLPDEGPLAIYPLLLAWIYEFELNILVAFRFADMAVAMLASIIFLVVIKKESGSWVSGSLIALFGLFTMNQPEFIQSGFKNSMFAAYIPLLLAYHVGNHSHIQTKKRWILVGVLLTTCLFLRETFLPFVLIGLVAIWIAYSKRAFVRTFVTMMVFGTSVLVLIAVLRGGVVELISSYIEMGAVYDSYSDRRMPNFIRYGRQSVQVSVGILVLLGFVLMLYLSVSLVDQRFSGYRQHLFWLACTLAPLLEPFLKFGFPYHFSVCIPGLVGLTASLLADSKMHQASFSNLAVLHLSIMMLGIVFLTQRVSELSENWPDSQALLEHYDSRDWPEHLVAQSNFLIAATEIKKVAKPGDRLAVSGFMFALYPLTGLVPPNHALSNLSALAGVTQGNALSMDKAIRSCPPEIIMTTTRPIPYSELIADLLEQLDLYQAVATVEQNSKISAGRAGGTIYRRVTSTSGCDQI